MPLLDIALQEGFENDLVAIRINGKEVFSKPQVSTRRQLGFADSYETDVGGGAIEVTLELPQRPLSASRVLQVSGPTYVGISVTAEGLQFDLSQEPFGYYL
jgi:hypothetical protein